MPSIGDQILNDGCAAQIELVHGETITILSGADAGQSFLAVNENEEDLVLDSNIGADPRAKRIIRFRSPVPNLTRSDVVQTEDGKRWNAIKRPGAAYLTTDFELKEIVSGKDT